MNRREGLGCSAQVEVLTLDRCMVVLSLWEMNWCGGRLFSSHVQPLGYQSGAGEQFDQ